MAKKPASTLTRILVAACAYAFRVDPITLQIVASPVLVRALIRTIARSAGRCRRSFRDARHIRGRSGRP